MDFDQLNTFLEVVKLRSFSRAGQKVFRSQSAVSAQIRQLEQEYGEKLLDRSAKTVQLTPAGEALLEYATRMVALRLESQRAVADQGGTPRGVLLVGANEATCLYVLPDIFSEYHRLFPSVQISVYRNFSRKILQHVEEGRIDVGIVTLPVKSPRLRMHLIFRDRLVLMVSPRNPLAAHKSVRVRDIAEHPLIFPRTGHTRQLLDKMFRPYRAKLRVSMELASVGMIKKFVAAGLGVSLISASFAREEERAGEVRLIEIDGVERWRELGLIFRRDRTLPRAASAFIELARQPSAIRGTETASSSAKQLSAGSVKPPAAARAVR
jgi:DNA-binding transcriptional LysR family regulator